MEKVEVIKRLRRLKSLLSRTNHYKGLPKLNEKNFNMGCWKEETECGTVMCAAGYAAHDPWFNERGLIMKDDSYPFHKDSGKEGISALAEFFGISYEQSCELFSLSSTRYCHMDNISIELVIDTINEIINEVMNNDK
jgi:hypothetical protein